MTTNDPLATALHLAQTAHAQTLKNGTAREILTAFRAVLVAEQALYADCGGAADLQTAVMIGYDIENADRELANLK